MKLLVIFRKNAYSGTIQISGNECFISKILVSGPLEYIENLLCEMSKEQEKLLPSPHALAIEFYSPFYLLLSMSDGTDCKETKEEIAQRYMRYIDDFFQKYFS